MAYLTVEQFKAMARLPPEYVDNVEICSAGFTALQLDLESAYIDSLLGKRYQVPFDPVTNKPPLVVLRWLVDLVSLQVWLRRGLDATQVDAEVYIEAAAGARKDLAEAANAKDGLFELPLRSDNPASAILRPRMRSYSETSPFLGQRIQREVGREEERKGHGTKH